MPEEYLSVSTADVSKAGPPPVRVGTLLSQTLATFRANFVRFSILAGVVMAPYAVLFLARVPSRVGGLLGLFVPSLLYVTLLSIGSGMVSYGVVHELRGSPVSVADGLLNGLRKIHIALSIGVLWGVSLGVVLFVIPGLFVWMKKAWSTGALGLGVSLGLVLIVVSGLYVWAISSVAVPAAVIEGTGLLAAFQRSRALTSGHRWTIAVAFGLIAVGLSLSARALYFGFGWHPVAAVSTRSVLFVVGAALKATFVGVAYYQHRASQEYLDLPAITKVFE